MTESKLHMMSRDTLKMIGGLATLGSIVGIFLVAAESRPKVTLGLVIAGAVGYFLYKAAEGRTSPIRVIE